MKIAIIDEIQGTAPRYEGDNALTDCILKLPARYREMILLRYSTFVSAEQVIEDIYGTLADAITAAVE